MNILGYNCNVFNAAASLVKDGRLIAAAQEERFNRQKHSGEMPIQAIQYCLSQGGITVDDLDYVGFHWQPFLGFHKRIGLILRHLPASLRYYDTHGGRWMNMVKAPRIFERKMPPSRGKRPYSFVRVKHHLCHAASAFLVSPHDQAATLTVDGSGEIASTTLGVGQGNRIRVFKEIHFPHSLGYLYVALTHYLGFTPDSDEYKVMALASFGEPRYYDAFKKIVRLKPGGGYEFDLSYFNYQRGIRMPWVSKKFIRAFGPRRRRGTELTRNHYDIAWALQKRLEDAVLHLARHLHRRTGLKDLCFAGGTALNCRLNQVLLKESPFENVFVQPAANDAGTSIGSAFFICHDLLDRPREFVLKDMYLGPGYSRTQCRMALDDANLPVELTAEDELIERTADLLVKGKVVAWFQGRMEMGPRALGNRSILADPRRAEMKDIINSKVKHREAFRPFAPSVLLEAAAEYFEGARPSPYMLFVFPVRPEKIDVIPAVAHVDGTARIQTVTRETNPRFFKLLEAFERRTGVPVLLNTSFNVMGEPIVCTPQEAIACYRSTQIDALALNDFLAVK